MRYFITEVDLLNIQNKLTKTDIERLYVPIKIIKPNGFDYFVLSLFIDRKTSTSNTTGKLNLYFTDGKKTIPLKDFTEDTILKSGMMMVNYNRNIDFDVELRLSQNDIEIMPYNSETPVIQEHVNDEQKLEKKPIVSRNIIKVNGEFLIDLDNVHSMNMDYDDSTSVSKNNKLSYHFIKVFHKRRGVEQTLIPCNDIEHLKQTFEKLHHAWAYNNLEDIN